jgi:uncharacterized protein YjbI with pentapeptide repeats
LTGADLHNADLSSADVTGADVTGANLIDAELAGARYDATTVWPNGFEPPPSAQLMDD